MTMASAGSDAILARLEQLERGERRNQILIAILAALVMVLGVVLPLTRSTVTARAFVLESGGRARATLSLSDEGAPGLILNDGQGKLRAALQVSPEGVPALLFGDPEGNVRAVMGLPSDGTPSVVLLTERGRVSYMTP